MNSKFILIFLMTSMLCFSQKKKINLPEGDAEIKVSQSTIISSLYITKQEELFLEDKAISLEEIGPEIQYIKYKLPINRPVSFRVFIYADKNVKYHVIDKIKTQLAHANVSAIVFKTGTIEDKDILKGNSFFNYYSIFRYPLIFNQNTQKEIEQTRRFNDSLITNNSLDIFPPPPPPPIKTTYNIYPSFYTDRQALIEEVLDNKTYKCLSMREGEITIDNKSIKYKNLRELDKILGGIHFLIIKFKQNLKFKEYLQTLSYIKNIQLPLFKSKQKGFHIIEISKEIEEIHKKAGINLCD